MSTTQTQLVDVIAPWPTCAEALDVTLARARLADSAPELLDHLMAIAGYADAPHVAPEKALAYILETARAAIAKAVQS